MCYLIKNCILKLSLPSAINDNNLLPITYCILKIYNFLSSVNLGFQLTVCPSTGVPIYIGTMYMYNLFIYFILLTPKSQFYILTNSRILNIRNIQQISTKKKIRGRKMLVGTYLLIAFKRAPLNTVAASLILYNEKVFTQSKVLEDMDIET